MTQETIEIIRIDPMRWAWLHAPLGFVLGVMFVAWYFVQESGVDAEMFVEGAVCIVIGIPCIVFVIMATAWLQATLFNGIFRKMRGGPVIEIRAVDDECETVQNTVEQRTEQYLSAHAPSTDPQNR